MHSGGLPHPSRRSVLAVPCAAGVAALCACSTYGGSSAGSEPAVSSAPAPPVSPPGQAPSTSVAPTAGGAPPLARLADIPVGGGKIFEGQKVVVTQPQAGTIRAFSTTCTHAGCAVNAIANGTINCPCHGSKYRVADGTVAGGPAPRPLAKVAVQVNGDEITLG